MALELNRTESPLSREERYKINANWTKIEQGYGVAVNGSEAAIKTANEAKNTATLANATAEATAQQLENVIVESGTSDAETIAARTDTITNETYATLGERLDAQVEQLNEKIDKYAINAKYPPYPLVGAVGDGTTDDTTTLNNIANYVSSLGANYEMLIPYGNYKITDTVMIKCPLNASQATFNYYGTGTALKIGDDTASNIITPRKTFRLPRVINKSRGNNGWDGTSEGVKCINLNTCEVYVPFIQDFEKGLIAFGNDGGNAYNSYYLGALWENHKNLVLDTTPTGYTNQNIFFNGRLQQSTMKGAVLNDPNAYQILMSTDYGGGPNNNIFINTSFEGEAVAYYRVDMSGKYNQFINCRWEYVGTKPRVHYRSTAQWNNLNGGYALQDVEEVFDGTLTGNAIRDNVRIYMRAENSTGKSIPNNAWTTVNGWTSVGRRISYDDSTGRWKPRQGSWLINATMMFAGNNVGTRQLRILVNGSVRDVCTVYPNTSNQVTLKSNVIHEFNGQDEFEIQVFQASGADLALNPSGTFCHVEAEYLG